MRKRHKVQCSMFSFDSLSFPPYGTIDINLMPHLHAPGLFLYAIQGASTCIRDGLQIHLLKGELVIEVTTTFK